MFFNEWLDILFYKKKPEQVVAEKPALGQALVSYVVALILVLIISSISNVLVLKSVPGGLAVAVTGSTIGALIAFIVVILFVLIVALLLHVFALIVGGKGDFGLTIASIIKLDAAFTGTIGVLSALVGLIIAAVPALAMIALAWDAVEFIAGLYLLVLMVLLIKAAHKLSTGRAVIAVIVIPLVIGIVLALVVGAFIMAMLLGVAGSSSYAHAGLFSLLG